MDTLMNYAHVENCVVVSCFPSFFPSTRRLIPSTSLWALSRSNASTSSSNSLPKTRSRYLPFRLAKTQYCGRPKERSSSWTTRCDTSELLFFALSSIFMRLHSDLTSPSSLPQGRYATCPQQSLFLASWRIEDRNLRQVRPIRFSRSSPNDDAFLLPFLVFDSQDWIRKVYYPSRTLQSHR